MLCIYSLDFQCIMLCEFLIFMLLKFSLKLIHKKAKGPRRIKSLDTGNSQNLCMKEYSKSMDECDQPNNPIFG